MTQEVLKQMYQLLLTEPHAPNVCAQLERIAREALADHAMRETQRLGQEIEQEPVAWGVFEGNLHDMFFTEAEAVQMADLKGTHAEVKPLYTTPPQRTWVGLTAEEVLQCWEKAHEPGNKEHINAIRMTDEVEQALKEKNT